MKSKAAKRIASLLQADVLAIGLTPATSFAGEGELGDGSAAVALIVSTAASEGGYRWAC